MREGTPYPRPEPWRGLAWLSARECLRVSKLWTQTMLAPVVSSILFILVFGLSLGTRIREVSGFEYEVFIVPGLIAMAMAQAAYSNNSSSIFQARSDRNIDDVPRRLCARGRCTLASPSAAPSGRC